MLIAIFFLCFFIASKHLVITADYDNYPTTRYFWRKYSYWYYLERKLEKKNKRLYNKQREKFLRLSKKNKQLEEVLGYAKYLIMCTDVDIIIYKQPKLKHKDLVKQQRFESWSYIEEEFKRQAKHGNHGSKGQKYAKIRTKAYKQARELKYNYCFE